MSKQIIDDVYTNILVDIEKIQAKPTMYISHTGPRAALHLSKEIINNAIDEYLNENSISDGSINIHYDEVENMIFVEDTGRGIPFEELVNACTILHSGTKMLREHASTSGENGVGITATNALSKRFELTSYRNGKMKFIQFIDGKQVIDRESTIRNKDKHGLLVAFSPSPIYLGSECKLPVDELDDWLTKLSFMMNPGIKIKFTIATAGKESTGAKIYKNTKSIGGFLEKFQPDANLLKTPVVLTTHSTILEENIPTRNNSGEVVLIDKTRNIELEVAINYNPNGQQDVNRYSFVNNIETIEHGEHVTGVINAFVNFMRKKVKEANKKSEIEVTNVDILTGLSVVLYMNTDFSTGLFTSQTKHKMDNHLFYDPIRKMTMDALEEYFKLPDSKRILTRLVAVVVDNIKARQAATKARVKVKRERKSFMDTTDIDGYTAPNTIDKDGAYRELYIVEGDSAGGSARAGRFDPDTQGTLGLTGKPSNIYGVPYNVLTKATSLAKDMKELFDDVLGCGYGDHFSMDNLLYDKIIIMPDADVDGDHIAGLVTSNIYEHARPLITEGKVYRAITPLYRLSGTKKNGIDADSYIYSKDKYFDIYEARASDVIGLKFEIDGDFISKKNMKRFLETNREYFKWLDTMAGQYTLHRDIIEYMASHSDFRDTITEFGHELKYDSKNDSITGIYDGRFYNIILDKIFINNLRILTNAIDKGNMGVYQYHTYKRYKNKPNPEYLGHYTIGQIMAICQEFEVPIESRYKGLGELTKEEMRALAMDPNNRVLVRLTVDDIESTTNIMDDLFLKDRRAVRKQMLVDMNVSIDDIDN